MQGEGTNEQSENDDWETNEDGEHATRIGYCGHPGIGLIEP